MSSKPYTSVPMLPGPVTVPDSVLEIMRRRVQTGILYTQNLLP